VRQSATKHDGSWWNDWVQWLAERSGNRKAAPAMGSEAHPVIESAPGSYVLEK
jgi:polyhydroxyalkanoate synthase